MVRTLGARDLRRRKTRSDKGKKHKTYRGNKPKTKRLIKFEKRQGNKTHIKLRWMEKRRMSLQGWRNWDPKIRMKVRPYVYIFGSVILTPVSDISTKADIEEWALESIGFPGYFLVMGISQSLRSWTKRKWVVMFDVQIKETATGLRARMVRNRRLFRYKWFYKD